MIYEMINIIMHNCKIDNNEQNLGRVSLSAPIRCSPTTLHVDIDVFLNARPLSEQRSQTPRVLASGGSVVGDVEFP